MSEPTTLKTDIAYVTERVIGYGAFGRFQFPEINIAVRFGDETQSLDIKSGEQFFLVIPAGKERL